MKYLLLGQTWTDRFYRIWVVIWLSVAAAVYNFGPHLRSRPEYILQYHLLGRLFGGLALFDGSNYLTIATHGYVAALPGLRAFFPLYPLVLVGLEAPVRFFTVSPMAFIVLALITSLVCLAVAVKILQWLIELDYSEKTSRTAHILLMVWPFSFFFLAPYTESLFLLLAVAAFYAARRSRWALAGILAALASATRLPGLLVGLALIVEYLDQHEWDWRHLFPQISWLALSPVGALAYFTYLHIYQGGWHTYFDAYRASWPDRHFSLNFFQPITTAVVGALSHHHLRPNDAVGLVMVAIMLAAIFLAWKHHLRVSYQVFMVTTFILPLLSGSLDSVGRYYMLAFPTMIVFATLLEGRHKLLWLVAVVSGLTSLTLMAAFVAGVFVG